MSRAFVREDVDPPERSGRARSSSGLPPGAANYMTARGAAILREKLKKLRAVGGDHVQEIAELERILSSASLIERPANQGTDIVFGAKVTTSDSNNRLTSYRIVGVDELDLYPGAVSWISPTGRALLAAELGHSVSMPQVGPCKVVKVEYPKE